MRKRGISGLGVGMVAAGAYLIYAGITDTPLVEGLRDVLQGEFASPK